MQSYRYSYCRECLCMNLSDRARYDNDKAYSTAWCKYFNINDNACERYFRFDENRRESSSGCYLTTIVCEILGLEDDSDILNTMRNFRDNYMLNRPETYVSLIEYDIVGPKIAEALKKEAYSKEIAYLLLNERIIPIVEKIKSGKNEEALEDYTNMTNRLKEIYHIDTTITNKLDIKIKTLGHARS